MGRNFGPGATGAVDLHNPLVTWCPCFGVTMSSDFVSMVMRKSVYACCYGLVRGKFSSLCYGHFSYKLYTSCTSQ